MKTLTLKTLAGTEINTRSKARQAAKEINSLKNKYISAKVADCKESDQRWAVKVSKLDANKITIERKSKGSTLAHLEQETAHNAVQWLRDKPSKSVNVFIKHGKL